MIRKVVCLSLGMVCILAGLSLPAISADLVKVRSGVHKGFTRVVLDVSGPVQFSDAKSDGEQLYFAVSGLSPKSLEKKFAKSHAPLKSLKVEAINDTTAKVTFQAIGKSMSAKVSKYEPDFYGGHRVVIDLRFGDVATNALALNPGTSDPEEYLPESRSHVAGKLNVTPEERQKRQERERLVENLGKDDQLPVPQSGNDHALTEASQDNDRYGHGDMKALGGQVKVSGLTAHTKPEASAFARARTAFVEGRAEDACQILEKHFPAGSWDIDALVLKGHCQTSLGDFQKAEEIYSQVLAFSPEEYEARIGIARLFEKVGDLVAARDHYREALKVPHEQDQTEHIMSRLRSIEIDLATKGSKN